MNSSSAKYRSKAIAQHVIGFSTSYQRENLLARGLGLEHLRELLLRLARPLLRQGASLAYGGNWKEAEDNFTFDLLRLISSEQEDNSLGGPDTNLTIGRLYNHAAWPYYLEITPQIEAQWINCCRIVRISQQEAGLAADEIVADADAASKSDRVMFNTACCLSAMRRLMNGSITINVPDASGEIIPPVSARIVLGGKTTGFSGFVPGVFEEALLTLEASRPLYLLGGFGGATEVLTQAMLSNTESPPPELTVAWHEQATKGYADLLRSLQQFRCPTLVRKPDEVFGLLWQRLLVARSQLAAQLNTGLSDEETRQLLTTRDIKTAIRLVRAGIAQKCNLSPLPA